MSLLQTGANHYHSRSRLADKSLVIKRLVVCKEVWLGSKKGMGLRTSAKYIGTKYGTLLWSGQDSHRAHAPQHPITYNIMLNG